MKKSINLKLGYLKVILTCLFLVPWFVNAQVVSRSLIGVAGHNFTNSNLQVSYSVGEPMVMSYNTSGLILNQGFQQNGAPFSTVGVVESSNYLDVSIFPNPSANLVHVEVPFVNLKSIQLNLFDASGKRISCSRELNSKGYTLNIEHLSPGLYFINIQVNNQNKTHQIIKTN